MILVFSHGNMKFRILAQEVVGIGMRGGLSMQRF